MMEIIKNFFQFLFLYGGKPAVILYFLCLWLVIRLYQDITGKPLTLRKIFVGFIIGILLDGCMG